MLNLEKRSTNLFIKYKLLDKIAIILIATTK